MKAEIKEVLKDEIKAVQKSKIAVLIGIGMVALDVVLVISSFISIYSLIFTLPLIFLIRKQIQEYRMNEMILILTRVIIDEDYAKTFNTDENGK